MNEAHFKSAFLLSPIVKKHIPLTPGLKQAAVLVPFVVRDGKLNVLLTRRALHLRHHPGQISFPGGRFETTDNSLADAALRETEEEIGIKHDLVSIIGEMGHYRTVSNYVVTPFVGFVDPNYQLTIDSNEVEDAFEVPWQFFVERETHVQLEFRRQGDLHQVHFMPFNEKMIWGTTAQMLHDLVGHFE